MKFNFRSALPAVAAFCVGGLGVVSVLAQTATPPAAAPSPAQQAIKARKAAFTLIASNFGPLGAVLKGDKPYDAADAQKRIARLVALSEILNDSFPDVSNVGLPDTKTKAEAWKDPEAFKAKLKGFQDDLAALQTVNAADKSGSEAFKKALGAVAQDCKSCHDSYREK